MASFIQGDTVTIETEFWGYDSNNNKIAQDPDSHSIKVIDPTGTLKHASTSPSRISSGNYRLDYDLPDDCELGNWEVIWIAVLAGKDRKLIDIFAVYDEIIEEVSP